MLFYFRLTIQDRYDSKAECAT